jgi:hypothetical protein
MPAGADKTKKQTEACFFAFSEQVTLPAGLLALLFLLLGSHVELLSGRLR